MLNSENVVALCRDPSIPYTSNSADPLLTELTHIFFEKIDGEANIKTIKEYTFKSVSSL